MFDFKTYFAIFVILQVLDVLTTVYILDHGGRELNPALRFLMNKLGVKPALVLFKCLIIYAFYTPMPDLAMQVVILFYVAVITNNFLAIRKLKG